MTDCPEWTENPSPSRCPSFRYACKEAYTQLRDDVLSAAYVLPEAIEFWHYILFHRVVPLDYYAGHYRRDDPDRPCLGCNVHVNGVSGSDFSRVRRDMMELFTQLRTTVTEFELRWPLYSEKERAKRLSVLLGYLVGRFIRIHPFINGNGHISRMLWAWGLSRFCVPIQARISPRPDPPYSEMMAAAMRDDFRPLMLSILQHLAENPPNR